MHGFTHGGAHLVFQDGFGLTRFTPPKAVKTDKDASGLSLTLGDAYVLAHAHRSNRRALRTLPALARAKWPFSDYGDHVLMPDGEHGFEPTNDGGKLFRVSGESLATFRWPDGMASVGALDLGRARPAKSIVPGRAATGPGDVLAVFNPYLRVVRVGRMTGPGAFEAAWQAEVNVPVGEALLFPGAAETFVGAWDPGLREARLNRVHAELRVEHRLLRSVSAPTFSGTRWCWQESDAVVCAAPWDALDQPTRFNLPAAVRGVGALMACGDAVYWVPLDGECIVDVVAGVVVDRKLGAADLALRTRAVDELRTFGSWLGAEGGSLRFGHVTRDKSGRTSWSPVFDTGAGSLSAHLAVGELLGRQRLHSGDPDALSVSSYSMPTGVSRVTLDDVRRGFGALDACGGQILRASCGLEYPLKEYFEPAYNDRHRRGLAAPDALFDPLAGAALLRAIMETVSRGERVPLGANVDRWSATPITVDELLRFDHPTEVWDAAPAIAGAPSLPMITAWLALDLLRADAAPVLARWLVGAPSPFARSNPHIAHEPATRMMQYFPATEAAFKDACGDGQGAAILRGVESELRA